ncbi:cytochrome c oxidase subunit 2 [Halorubrum alkaliphilum]|uniref:Cytochrome c oxidase subunit 2 n=1 Tax=Halorubrum alkaliphilum TaxID=261290 RepID=A0A8T4GH58_9EURY|nr:cytochrome c oxidase subunit II [Halorubrum alkaliphilum]MBP1922375.1 cytochrome c oxidase subunit 2 [Halorubrum alkaliphilum]
MHIHAYEKLWLALSIVLILLLIGSVTYGAVGPGIAMVSDSGGQIDATALDEDDRFADPRVEQVGENSYEVYVVAFQYGFDPGTIDPIVVPENSEVTFYITSPDVIHGFEVVGTNANTMVVPGEVAEITVEANEPREYGIVCNEYCGAGHHDMEGTMEVVTEEEYAELTEGGEDA